jgi:CHAT domain-containing protein
LPEAANKLSQMLLSPVAAQLGEKRLLIVADGALQYVPFAALPEPASTSPANNTGSKSVTSQPLVVKHEIVSLPSASTLAVLRREVKGRAPAPNMVAVLADPVFSKDEAHFDEAIGLRKSKDAGKSSKIASAAPSISASVVRALQETGIARGGLSIPRLGATRREADSILDLVPKGAGVKRLDFEASRATVESGELARYRIVHFATHGFLNGEHPELSGIVLSLVDERGEPQDGFIRLHEIYNLKLPAELIVLSACQTALGKEIKGEGLVGLTRGFMYAGAPRVVASLWKVDDAATKELMERFYRAMLTDKLRPAAALRRAQIGMAKQITMGKPYNWAAFVLQGEWR